MRFWQNQSINPPSSLQHELNAKLREPPITATKPALSTYNGPDRFRGHTLLYDNARITSTFKAMG